MFVYIYFIFVNALGNRWKPERGEMCGFNKLIAACLSDRAKENALQAADRLLVFVTRRERAPCEWSRGMKGRRSSAKRGDAALWRVLQQFEVWAEWSPGLLCLHVL